MYLHLGNNINKKNPHNTTMDNLGFQQHDYPKARLNEHETIHHLLHSDEKIRQSDCMFWFSTSNVSTFKQVMSAVAMQAECGTFVISDKGLRYHSVDVPNSKWGTMVEIPRDFFDFGYYLNSDPKCHIIELPKETPRFHHCSNKHISDATRLATNGKHNIGIFKLCIDFPSFAKTLETQQTTLSTARSRTVSLHINEEIAENNNHGDSNNKHEVTQSFSGVASSSRFHNLQTMSNLKQQSLSNMFTKIKPMSPPPPEEDIAASTVKNDLPNSSFSSSFNVRKTVKTKRHNNTTHNNSHQRNTITVVSMYVKVDNDKTLHVIIEDFDTCTKQKLKGTQHYQSMIIPRINDQFLIMDEFVCFDSFFQLSHATMKQAIDKLKSNDIFYLSIVDDVANSALTVVGSNQFHDIKSSVSYNTYRENNSQDGVNNTPPPENNVSTKEQKHVYGYFHVANLATLFKTKTNSQWIRLMIDKTCYCVEANFGYRAEHVDHMTLMCMKSNNIIDKSACTHCQIRTFVNTRFPRIVTMAKASTRDTDYKTNEFKYTSESVVGVNLSDSNLYMRTTPISTYEEAYKQFGLLHADTEDDTVKLAAKDANETEMMDNLCDEADYSGSQQQLMNENNREGVGVMVDDKGRHTIINSNGKRVLVRSKNLTKHEQRMGMRKFRNMETGFCGDENDETDDEIEDNDDNKSNTSHEIEKEEEVVDMQNVWPEQQHKSTEIDNSSDNDDEWE